MHILAADYHPGAILPAFQVLAGTDPKGLAGAAVLATANPAKALGLDDRGRLQPGLRADLAVVDPAGMGRVIASFSRGEVIFSNGSLPGLAERVQAVA
ncbi:amidohydrolase family protein [Thalassovita aquimarina]|uniref:amidohydrolase family protein n=1 Tax=Thalassovita aquimarina TaxID=2785917 RepID=UPI001FE5A29D|nr:amidohydrolase family protein [Thalassovita aquimarina]